MCGYGSVFLGECYGSVPVCMEMPAVLVENKGAECDHGSVIVSVCVHDSVCATRAIRS